MGLLDKAEEFRNIDKVSEEAYDKLLGYTDELAKEVRDLRKRSSRMNKKYQRLKVRAMHYERLLQEEGVTEKDIQKRLTVG